MMDFDDPGDAAGLTADDFCALLDLDDDAEEEEEDEAVLQEELRRRLLGDLPAEDESMEVEEAGLASAIEAQAPEGSATEEDASSSGPAGAAVSAGAGEVVEEEAEAEAEGEEPTDVIPAEPTLGVADVAPMDDEEEEVDLDTRSSELARFLASSVCGEVGLSYRALINHLSAHTRALAAASADRGRQPVVEASTVASNWVDARSGALPVSRGPVSVKLKVPNAKPLVTKTVHRMPRSAPGPAPVVVLDEVDGRGAQTVALPVPARTEAPAYAAIPIPKAMEEGLERLRRKLAERR